MGFDPLRCSFVKAVQVIYEGTESAWEHRMEVYRRCGWTDYEIMLMFRQGPYIMKSSEKKIMSGMDFLVNRMGWQPAAIARFPIVFLLNLEKRTIPRCSVVKVLRMKGLVKKDLSLSAILACKGFSWISETNSFAFARTPIFHIDSLLKHKAPKWGFWIAPKLSYIGRSD
ncbi:hypothetical protein CK203_094550 [Vitis vinifera]|uniref:Uncharacterized protein n=1 Tax=Vitis vinifera TaxID=29760 RepID=A0A438CJN1_VITVI|nr:hypothetical protein CK203_094550 [Vitis vinifera]